MERSRRRGFAAGAAVLALAALGAALLAGCGSGEPAEASSPATIRVDAGRRRPARPWTPRSATPWSCRSRRTPRPGYEWTFTAGDTFTIEKSEYVPDPNPDQLAGKGGAQVVTLKVTKAGESDLDGHLCAQLGDAVAGRRSGRDGDDQSE